MPIPVLFVPILIAAAAADDAPIVVKAFPWAPFISPMGEPFRPPATGEPPIAKWFVQADLNRDGVLTVDEMQADADRFFARLDSDHDGQIVPDEIKAYEYEIAPEVQVNSNWKRPRGETAPEPKAGRDHPPGYDWGRRPGDQNDGYWANGLQGAARYGLLNLPQPVMAADADFNRAVTQTEFRQAAAYRFQLLDGGKQGRITLAELEERLPIRPKGKRTAPKKDEPDARVGLPLPKGD